MSIQKLKNPLTEDYFNYKDYVLSDGNIPWFFKNRTTYFSETYKGDKPIDIGYFSHTLVDRPHQEHEYKYAIPKVDSSLFKQSYLILKSILNYNNITLNVLYRLNLNLTLHQTPSKSVYHIDLPYPHKIFILYLNTCSGETFVKVKDQELKSKPKEDKVIVFDGKYKHCQGVPKLDEKRVILVANYI